MKLLITCCLILVVVSVTAQRKIVYNSLEVAYIGLNVLDVVSTYKIIDRGGYEANPLMAKFVDNKVAFIGVKAISTTAFLGACRIIKKDKPKLAFALLLAGNVGYGFLINHNYQVYLRLKI